MPLGSLKPPSKTRKLCPYPSAIPILIIDDRPFCTGDCEAIEQIRLTSLKGNTTVKVYISSKLEKERLKHNILQLPLKTPYAMDLSKSMNFISG